mmetsp:Transcript_90276/g.146022  ORF Transcript_90276/g.146022 Transcript_90276/m.146022 type:complete len:494 (-) Transcript_90276:323-1804(-)
MEQILRRSGGSGGCEGSDNSTTTAGVIACVIGNTLVSLSFNLQRLAHRNNTAKIPYTKLKGWWLGIVCMFVGEIGNFLAYGMAPAALVSPLGAITVISNAVLSKVMLNEPMPRQKAVGVLAALVGAVLIATNAPSALCQTADGNTPLKEEEQIYASLMTWRALIYTLGVFVTGFCVSNPLKLPFLVSEKYRTEQVIVNCILCGLAGTMTVAAAKAVFSSLSQAFSGNPAMFIRGDICWLTYVTIIIAIGSIVGQVKYMNAALIVHGTSAVVPVYYITFTTITMSAGMVLFLEIDFEPMEVRVPLFILGLLFAFGGVFLINALKENHDHTDGEGKSDSEDEAGVLKGTELSHRSPVAENSSNSQLGSENTDDTLKQEPTPLDSNEGSMKDKEISPSKEFSSSVIGNGYVRVNFDGTSDPKESRLRPLPPVVIPLAPSIKCPDDSEVHVFAPKDSDVAHREVSPIGIYATPKMDRIGSTRSEAELPGTPIGDKCF